MAAEEGAFLQSIKAHFEQMRGETALATIRQKAWERFIALGLPSREDEAFRSVSLRDLYSTTFHADQASKSCEENIAQEIAKVLLPESRHSHVVFVNGVFCPHLSDTSELSSGSVVLTFSQAMRSHGHFLERHLLKAIKEENDPFALLNLALHPSGLFLYIAPKLHISQPIQCIQIATCDRPQLCVPRIQLALGAHSAIKWISTQLFLNEQQSHCSIPHLDLFLDEGAHFHFFGHLFPLTSDWCFDTIRAHLKRDAALKALSVISGSKATRQNIHMQCAGENSEADIKGLWMLSGSLHAHAHVIIDHSAPRTRSMQLFKGILLDASQSSFEGKIIVRQAAQKTEAYQLNNNLILGQAALAHSKPNLEIFADDVKASHGATFARPDEAQLFYLKSRGIHQELAQHLLMHGFYQEILDQIPYVFLRKSIEMSMRGNKR